MVLLALVGLFAAVTCLLVAFVCRWLFPPLPFTGPWSGQVVDAVTGTPIPGARVKVKWTCHDSPLPNGAAHEPVYAVAKADAAGKFALKPPNRRGGRFGTDIGLSVTATGYIDAVFVVDPNATPLPPSAAAWPFADTTVQKSLSGIMTIRLRPARPVLLKALKSPDSLIRTTAQEKLAQLSRGSD